MNASFVRKAFSIIAIVASGTGLRAQNVAVVNGVPINSKEFLWVYLKNHGNETNLNYKDLVSYLDLYVNFKLKVTEARNLGLDQDTTYKSEIAGYEDALRSQKKIAEGSKEYEYVINEYKEGVLMFNASEQKVWNKVPDNETELRSFFDKNDKYKGKAFDEVKGQLVADYQQKLEEEWVKNLRLKYKIKINQAELKKLAK